MLIGIPMLISKQTVTFWIPVFDHVSSNRESPSLSSFSFFAHPLLTKAEILRHRKTNFALPSNSVHKLSSGTFLNSLVIIIIVEFLKFVSLKRL